MAMYVVYAHIGLGLIRNKEKCGIERINCITGIQSELN